MRHANGKLLAGDAMGRSEGETSDLVGLEFMVIKSQALACARSKRLIGGSKRLIGF
jgi:hypothetical protein